MKVTLTNEPVVQIMADVLLDVDYVDHATKTVRTAVVASYVDSLWWSHG